MQEAMKKQEEQLLFLQDQIRDLTIDKQILHDLTLNLLGCRRPSPSYPIFLWERYFLFQLKAIMEGITYLCSSTRTFLDVFRASDFDEQSLLREFFLHNIICEHVSMQMIVIVFPYMGGLQLRAFVSFMRNHIEWHLAIKSMETNEEKTTLWVRAEPGRVAELRREFM